MVNHLQISNFESLDHVELRELSEIVYLVGSNGSGKSLVLKYVYQTLQNCFWIKDCANPESHDDRLIVLDQVPMLNLPEEEYRELVTVVPIIDDFAQSTTPERSGQDKLIKLAKYIYHLVKHKKAEYFLLEEPEIHLHPSLQKIIAEILDQLVRAFPIQIFVETHSPFLVSSSGQITSRDEKYHEDEVGFRPTQKVFFLKNGSVADKFGRPSHKGEYGYWGSKVSVIGARMLGAGIGDFVHPLEAQLTPDAPIVFFCEGQGDSEDARIYNEIFEDREPRVLFVSSRGSSQLESTFQVMREIKPGLSANFRLLMVRDRDHEFRSTSDINRFQHNHPGVKVLMRRAIECYLFNSETASLIYEHFGQTLPIKYVHRLDNLNNQIQKEAERGVPGSDYKIRLKETFLHALYPLRLSSEYLTNLELEIARLIHSNTEVYRELEKVLFSH